MTLRCSTSLRCVLRRKLLRGLRVGRLDSVRAEPRRRAAQRLVDVADVPHALRREPVAESVAPLPGEHRNTVLPGGPSAQDTGEFDARLCGQFQRLVNSALLTPADR